jgi:hypothetical protein
LWSASLAKYINGNSFSSKYLFMFISSDI